MRSDRWIEGFTLLELLVTVAVVGILSAVLIPNLMNARAAATERTAQVHSSNVYTVFVAALAEDTDATVAGLIADAAANADDCSGGGVVGSYTYNSGPAGLDATDPCAVTANGTRDFRVTVKTASGKTFVNGVQQ